MNKPVFSIIMPAYNAQATIKESIDSVIAQTYDNFELIIINDYSTDLTEEIIKSYLIDDKRIKTINLNKNSGVAVARNMGIKEAKGKYMAFLDSDDLWLPSKLKSQKNYLDEGYDIVFSAYIRFNKNSDKLIKPPKKTTYQTLLKGNYIGNLTGTYNCNKLGKIYQNEIGHEDYLMWLKAAENSEKIMAIKEPLAKYRVGNKSLSSNKIKSAKWVWNIYRKHLKLNLFRSNYYFIIYAIKSIKKTF